MLPSWRTSRSPPGHRHAKAGVETLRAELAKVEASAGRHRADFERERERADRLMTCSAGSTPIRGRGEM
jgi:hypothetical protein